MTAKDENALRTPLARVRGLGSARSGTGHFWYQRLTAVANIPLTIVFVVIVILVMGRSHAAVAQIIGAPLVAILLLLYVGSVTYHMRLGMQTVIEDYVHDELAKVVLLMGNTFFCIAVALSCTYAILKLSFGV